MRLKELQQIEPLEMSTLQASVVQVEPVYVDPRPEVDGNGLLINFRPPDVKKPAFAGFFSQPPDGHATPDIGLVVASIIVRDPKYCKFKNPESPNLLVEVRSSRRAPSSNNALFAAMSTLDGSVISR